MILAMERKFRGEKKVAFDSNVTQKIKSIGQADILIGIPILNNENTITHVAKAIKLGLIKYFP